MLAQRAWWTVQQVAETLQVDPETVRRWIRGKALPAVELGGTKLGYRIAHADLEAFLRRRTGAEGGAEAPQRPWRRLTEADIIPPEPIMPDDETADEMIETVRRRRREGGYA